MAYKIGIVGLGVMGHNLALNMERNHFSVACYDSDAEKMRNFMEGSAVGKQIIGADSLGALLEMLERPRRVMLLVPAGPPVDSVIADLKPYLQPGDVLMDAGNSFFLDTERRNRELEGAGICFMGVGVSGGEEGALWGPAIMPGGQCEAWDETAPILRTIAAKATDGEPCAEYMGPRGAGHYVKMVHNGIEYGDMQLIAEIYDLLRRGLGMTAADLSQLFKRWNSGELESYLVKITAEILSREDEETGLPLVDLILDEAAQKGTGKWTSQNALDVGAPIPTINAAVENRILSSLKAQRVHASTILHGPSVVLSVDREHVIEAASQALYAGKIVSYAQGLALLKIASEDYQYGLRLGDIAKIWRAGCIIRARLLGDIMDAFRREPTLANLLLDGTFCSAVERCQAGWRFLVQTAIGLGIPVPALSASLSYYDAYRSERLPANLTQAQRDYFGAHTFRRLDRDGVFHADWSPKRAGVK